MGAESAAPGVGHHTGCMVTGTGRAGPGSHAQMHGHWLPSFTSPPPEPPQN